MRLGRAPHSTFAQDSDGAPVRYAQESRQDDSVAIRQKWVSTRSKLEALAFSCSFGST
jgi:hypothetical protein